MRVRSLCWEDSLEKGMATWLLQYSCLENPRNSRAWWAIVLGVAKYQKLLKQFSMHAHIRGSHLNLMQILLYWKMWQLYLVQTLKMSWMCGLTGECCKHLFTVGHCFLSA